MLRDKERGEGKLGTIFGLALLAGAIFAGFHVVPVFYDHYNLIDKMTEMARAPKYNHPDDVIYDKLVKYTREERIDQFIKKANFSISTVDTSRRITVNYEREVEILPGWKHNFKFDKTVEGPLI